MSLIERLQSIQVSKRTAVLCLVALVVVAVVVIVEARNIAVSGPAGATTVRKPPAKATSVDVQVTQGKVRTAKPKAASVKAVDQKAPEKDPYAVIAERNLFRPVGALPPSGEPTAPAGKGGNGKKRGGPGGSVPQLPPVGGQTPPSPPASGGPGGGDFKKNIAFTGVVETSNGTQALIESLPTKETRFVSRGESAFGCRVVDIKPQSVSLEKDGSQFTLAIGENKPDTGEGSGGAKPSGGSPPAGTPPSGPEGKPRPG